MIAFAAAIFLSAFLLFLVQPLLGRFILPWYGGTPAAWSVALLFFQCALLAGYSYAHLLNRLRPGFQAGVHAAVLLAAALTLPVIPAESLKPVPADDPALSILWLLLRTVGLPFIALSATGPLLQAWLARLRPGKPPWVMYALSNIGSLGALLAYPFLIEPWMGRAGQAVAWSCGFGGFALLSVTCALIAMRRPTGQPSGEVAPPPRIERRVVWVALAACGVWLLMAVTNRMSLDLAPVPFLWVLPLALYLLSFVVTFSGEQRYRRSIAMFVVPLAVAGLAWAMSGNLPDETEMAIELRLALFAAGLFGLCWVLHGELYRLRPDVTRLTGYYLSISVGGAIGGAFVGLIAPRILPMYWEFQIGQALTLLAVPAALAIDVSSPLRGFKPRWAWLLLGIAFLLWADATRTAMGMDVEGTLAHSRSFFGVTRVFEDEGVRELRHGTTTHGVQWTDPEWRRTPISYYGEESGVGRAIALLEGKRRIGVVGLGTGTMAAYGRMGDVVRFYEIDAEVEHIARVWFWYLQDCEADLSVVIGDGRLQLERDEPQNFDVLVLDAFSSDSIPVHLLTLEAFAEYTRHVKPGGMLAVHITNRYVDLQPVIAAAARETGLSWVLIDDGREGDDLLSTDWALMSTDAEKLGTLGQTINPRVKDVRPWTDDYSNIFRVMK